MKDIEAVPLMDESKENAVRDTKKLIESFSAVYRHQFDKEPSQDEISKFLSKQNTDQEDETPEVDTSPSILQYKVIAGKSNKPLYFQANDKWFDCDSEEWLNNPPSVASELNERPITTNDLYYAIMHGLVDDDAYSQLHQKQLIPQESQKLYEKLQKLNQTVSELKANQENLEKAMPEMDEIVNDFSENENTALEDDFENNWDMPEVELGTDVVAEVLRLALESGVAPELEAAIRRIVKEEIMVLQQQQTPSQTLEPLTSADTEELDNQ